VALYENDGSEPLVCVDPDVTNQVCLDG
jgi:hypothetical protein